VDGVARRARTPVHASSKVPALSNTCMSTLEVVEVSFAGTARAATRFPLGELSSATNRVPGGGAIVRVDVPVSSTLILWIDPLTRAYAVVGAPRARSSVSGEGSGWTVGVASGTRVSCASSVDCASPEGSFANRRSSSLTAVSPHPTSSTNTAHNKESMVASPEYLERHALPVANPI
jgi:hypothetical protein